MKNVLGKCCCKKLDEEATRRERRSFMSATATRAASREVEMTERQHGMWVENEDVSRLRALEDTRNKAKNEGPKDSETEEKNVWKRHVSIETGQVYYEDSKTKRTSWALPEGATVVEEENEGSNKWKRHHSVEHGLDYFVNMETGASSWTEPESGEVVD